MRLIWPVEGPITRGFAYKSFWYVGDQHAAVDIAANSGTPIKAAADGTVVDNDCDKFSGNFISIEHEGGWRTTYRHLVRRASLEKERPVRQGEVIGNVGSTGLSTGPHLHFDLWNRAKQWPEAFYKKGWWAHDPEKIDGEDDMTEDEVTALINQVVPQLIRQYAPGAAQPRIDSSIRDHAGAERQRIEAAIEAAVQGHNDHRPHGGTNDP